MKAVISFLTLVASVLAQSGEFEEFLLIHNKVYKDDNELQARQKIFEENKKKIDEHNQRYAKGLETFEMGVNKFTDLSSSELKKYTNNEIDQNDVHKCGLNYFKPTKQEIPESVNWVDKGAVTPIKDQGKCGSCWAFAAVGTLEGQYFRKTGKLLELSEQNLLDCSSNEHYHNNGCNGGNAYHALQYVIENGGIQTEETYPYERHQSICRYRAQYTGFKIQDCQYVQPYDEYQLAQAVHEVGPIAVSMNSTDLHLYSRGVYNAPCDNSTNHGVTVVGYGYDSDGGDYWLIKNSWGEDWGERGYFRMARNRDNMCGIVNFPVYPIV